MVKESLRVCFHDTSATFILLRVHSSFVLLPYINFVYVIPEQNLIPKRVHSVPVQERGFHSGTKLIPMSCKGSMTVCSGIKSLSQESGRTSNPNWHYNHVEHVGWREVSLHVNAEWNLIPSYIHCMRSQCHTGMKLALVKVFTCKHPINLAENWLKGPPVQLNFPFRGW